MISQGLSGAARAAMALIGIPIAAGPGREERPGARESVRPDWPSEVDEDYDVDKPSLAFYSLAFNSELGEMHEARITGGNGNVTRDRPEDCEWRKRGAHNGVESTGRCSKTRR